MTALYRLPETVDDRFGGAGVSLELSERLCEIAATGRPASFPLDGFRPPSDACPPLAVSDAGVYWHRGFALGLERVLIGEPPEHVRRDRTVEALWLATVMLASVDIELPLLPGLRAAVLAGDEHTLRSTLSPRHIAIAALRDIDFASLRVTHFSAMSLWSLEWELADLIHDADDGPGQACACAGELDVPGHEAEAWSYLAMLDPVALVPRPVGRLPVRGFRPRYLTRRAAALPGADQSPRLLP